MAALVVVVAAATEAEKAEKVAEELQIMTSGDRVGVKRHRRQWKTVEIHTKQRP